MKSKKIFELHKIDTGFLIVMENKTLAFHDDTVRDDREKMFIEIIKILEWKHDFEVKRRRTE